MALLYWLSPVDRHGCKPTVTSGAINARSSGSIGSEFKRRASALAFSRSLLAASAAA